MCVCLSPSFLSLSLSSGSLSLSLLALSLLSLSLSISLSLFVLLGHLEQPVEHRARHARRTRRARIDEQNPKERVPPQVSCHNSTIQSLKHRFV